MGNLLFFISLFYLFKKSYRALFKASGIRFKASGTSHFLRLPERL